MKKENRDVATERTKSRVQPGWTLMLDLKRDVQKQLSADFSGLKQRQDKACERCFEKAVESRVVLSLSTWLYSSAVCKSTRLSTSDRFCIWVYSVVILMLSNHQNYLYARWLCVFACCSATIKHLACGGGCGFRAVCRTHSWIVVWFCSLLHGKHFQPCGLSLQWLSSRESGGSAESETSVKAHTCWAAEARSKLTCFTIWLRSSLFGDKSRALFRISHSTLEVWKERTLLQIWSNKLMEVAEELALWRENTILRLTKQAETTAPAVGFVFPPSSTPNGAQTHLYTRCV